MHTLISYLMIILTASIMTMTAKKIFQIFQLSSYRIRGVFNWLKITKFDFLHRYFFLAFFSFVSMFVFDACFRDYEYLEYLGYIAFIIFAAAFYVFSARGENKTPLKMTSRMLRFVTLTFALSTLLCLAVNSFLVAPLGYYIYGVLPIVVPFVAVLANLILKLPEKLNNYSYIVRAERKLDSMQSLIKIGITGSYGKTTTKNILAKILECRYNVAFSPSSYNTPMGICKVINNDLNSEHEIFIAEMGARNVGDIKELADIVHPNLGIVTNIGNQHLETFGSIDNIVATKLELANSLAAGGYLIINADSEPLYNNLDLVKCEYEMIGSSGKENCILTYDNVKFGANGTTFDIFFQGEKYEIATKLLGKHVPSLIAPCIVLAIRLGISIADICHAITELEPVPHRLELIVNENSIIIDDAYNSNCEGARNAVEVLSKFEGNKVVITPGLVELGKIEKEANTTFGMQIAEFCDYAILVGSRASDLAQGARCGGMAEDRVYSVKNLSEALEALGKVPFPRVVLFENDLPDNIK